MSLAQDRAAKIAFIQSDANFMKVDPYLDHYYVNDLIHKMIQAGFFKRNNMHVISETVIKLIREAQGHGRKSRKHVKPRQVDKFLRD